MSRVTRNDIHFTGYPPYTYIVSVPKFIPCQGTLVMDVAFPRLLMSLLINCTHRLTKTSHNGTPNGRKINASSLKFCVSCREVELYNQWNRHQQMCNLFEFSLNVFTEFSEFSDKNICHYSKMAGTCHPATSCVRDQLATTVPARHM